MASRFIIPNADVGAGISPSRGAQLFFSPTGVAFDVQDKDTFPTKADADAGTNPNANPVIADGKGVFPDIWIVGSNKVVLKDKNGVQTGFGETDPVISTIASSDLSITKATIAAMIADTSLEVGQSVAIENYTATNSSGVLFGKVVTAGTGTDDEGSFIDLPNTTPPAQWQQNFSRAGIFVEQFGAGDTGAPDDTTKIQECLRFAAGFASTLFQGKTYMVEAGAILPGNVAKEGIQIPSQSRLVFQPDTKLEVIATGNSQYNALAVYNVDDVVIHGNGGQLLGDLDTFGGARDFPGVFNGIGLRIQGSDNVFIYDLKSTRMYTDGFAVVYDDVNVPYPECTNVHFFNCNGIANFRNGNSIIGCIGGSIKGGNYSNNTGTAPQAGVDIEPNASKPDASPAIVSDFEVTGVKAVSNGTQGIVCDAAGTVQFLNVHHNITRNNPFGMLIKGADSSQVVNNINAGNTTADLLVYGSDTTLVDGNTTNIPAVSTDTAINISEKSQAVMLADSGLRTGVKVFDDTALDFGTDDFSIVYQVGAGDWTPAAEKYFYWKISGGAPNITGVLFAITPLGQLRVYLYRNDNGTTFTTLAENNFADKSVNSIAISVTRESVGADGAISFYINGALQETLVIPAATVVTLLNTGNLHIGGLNTAGQQEIALQSAIIYNDGLTSTEQMALYRDGIAETDKWSRCVFALEQEGIQPQPGLWLDSSTNKNHGRHPETLSTLNRYQKEFEIRWINTWAASSALMYLGEDNLPILPAGNIRIDSINAIASAGAINVIYGDGSDADRFVVSVALSSGFNEFTVANRNHDGTNRDFTITPSGSFTGTIETIVRGVILD